MQDFIVHIYNWTNIYTGNVPSLGVTEIETLLLSKHSCAT